MTSGTHANHLPAIGTHQRAEVGRELQATLVELLDLSLVAKQMHWTVVGPLFRPLHLQLDELADSWRELADAVAERAVTLGVWPDGQSGTIAADSDVAAVDRGELESRVVVRELTRRIAEVAERVRNRMDRLAELDAASQDVVTEVVRVLEQQLWMVRSQFDVAPGR